jgi:hypothetical protein
MPMISPAVAIIQHESGQREAISVPKLRPWGIYFPKSFKQLKLL